MHFDAVLIEPRRAAMKAAGFWLGKTPDDYFDANLAANPNAKALSAYTASTGASESFTWAELDRLADRCAIGLRKLGAGRNDVVCCQLPNSWQFVATYLGCSRIGAVFNPVMHIFRERELSFMLAHGEVKVFFVPKIFNKDLQQVRPRGNGQWPETVAAASRACRGARRRGSEQLRCADEQSRL
jgi:cyclohexanecarboxylate-CoA ligase